MSLSKQQALDIDPKGIQQIDFTGNLGRGATILFVTEKTKETVLKLYKGMAKILWI